MTMRKLLLALLVFEVALGGGGRWFEIGALSPRMLLWISCLGYVWNEFSERRLHIDVVVFCSIAAVTLAFSSTLGILNGANVEYLIEDIKPLSFLFVALFLSLAIKSSRDIDFVLGIWRWSGIALAVGYLATLGALALGYISFENLYDLLLETDEIKFRGDTGFFYKGFLYLGIGIVSWIYHRSKFRNPVITLILIALILTQTRGFLIALLLIFLLKIFFMDKRPSRIIATIALAIMAGPFLIGSYLTNIGDRTDSNAERTTQIAEVHEAMTLKSALIGHGFGVGIPSRDTHMEITYLEIFHKQGAIGILLWLAPLAYILTLYVSSPRTLQADTMLLAVGYVTIQTATNPYLNNPIGMIVLLIAFTSMRVLHEEGKKRLKHTPRFESLPKVYE